MTEKTERQPVIIDVKEEHHIALVRQRAKALAQDLGFARVAVYSIAASVTELANNLFFHAAHGGNMTLAVIKRDGSVGIEITAEDDGPGIPDIELAMQDGFSTNRGLGGGLPGVKRLMDEFEITSTVGDETRIVARKWKRCR